MNLTETITDLEPRSFAQGGFAGVHRALLFTDGRTDPVRVAIKFPNVHNIARGGTPGSVTKAYQRWQREIRAGQSVSHPNILRFLGFCENPNKDYKDFIGIVLPYCKNGDSRSYIAAHPEADRMHILCGAAAAICAMHSSSPPVIHGDIKASNILIGDSGQSLLSDFGLSRICETKGFTTECVKGTCRWMAVELLLLDDDEVPVRTTAASDIWAFAMTILEILTGELPFAQMKSDGKFVVDAIYKKIRPRPCNPRITDAIWTLLESCWEESPADRPDGQHVGLVLDIMYARHHDVDSDTVSAILEGRWDKVDILQTSTPFSTSLPYMCKWVGCPQRFETLEICIKHECVEFEWRSGGQNF